MRCKYRLLTAQNRQKSRFLAIFLGAKQNKFAQRLADMVKSATFAVQKLNTWQITQLLKKM
jgi:hypothetical protein